MDKQMLQRTKLFIFAVIIVFFSLFSRLAYLQIFNYNYYSERAEKIVYVFYPLQHRGRNL